MVLPMAWQVIFTAIPLPPPIRHGVGKFEFIIGKSKVFKNELNCKVPIENSVFVNEFWKSPTRIKKLEILSSSRLKITESLTDSTEKFAYFCWLAVLFIDEEAKEVQLFNDWNCPNYTYRYVHFSQKRIRNWWKPEICLICILIKLICSLVHKWVFDE